MLGDGSHPEAVANLPPASSSSSPLPQPTSSQLSVPGFAPTLRKSLSRTRHFLIWKWRGLRANRFLIGSSSNSLYTDAYLSNSGGLFRSVCRCNLPSFQYLDAVDVAYQPVVGFKIGFNYKLGGAFWRRTREKVVEPG